MMKHTRPLALLLTLILALSLTAPAAAYSSGCLVPQKKTYSTAFADTKGAWCEAAVKTVYEAGLMDGKSASAFDPSGSLTYAQILVITARLHELLHGGDGVLPAAAAGQAWYQPAVDYLTAQVTQDTEAAYYLQSMLEDGDYLAFMAAEPCDRYDFVWCLAAVLPESALTPINAITQLPDTGDTDILRFYNAGILTGSDQYGTFSGFDFLNRGQAAAMLARIVDPAQRVKFTPEVLVMSQAILGLAPETPMLTVGDFTVNAELYTYALTSSIGSMEMEHYFSCYDEYPDYFEAYLADEAFDGLFAEYLLEKYGIDVEAPIDWNTADKGGMSPAQKVREDTLTSLKQFAELFNHQAAYPLTAAQRAELQETLPYWQEYGYSADLAEQELTSLYLVENLTAKHAMSASDLNRYLTEQGYVYGQYVVLYRGDYRSYEYSDDAAAKAAAEKARQQISAHLDDAEYIEYLIWKYSEDYSSSPDLIPLEGFSEANQAALKNLRVGQVSQVLTEEDRYAVVLKLDPSDNTYVSELAASIPAMAQLTEWAESSKVTTAAAYDAVDVASAAAAYDALMG